MRKLQDILVRLLEVFLVVAFAALTLDVLWGVFTRYVMGNQAAWTEEAAIYLLIWISLLGAALTYKEKGHLGVDYFVGKMDPSAQKVAAIVVEVAVLLFAAGGLLYGGWLLVGETLEANQISTTLGWKTGYLYAAAPISGAFFILFAIEHIVEIVSGSVTEPN